MKKFRYESNGYHKDDVNQYLSHVVEEFDSLLRLVKNQREEINRLQEQLNVYKVLEKDADSIIMDAKDMASKILNESLIKVENEREKEKEIRQMKEKLQLIVEQQQAVIEDIDHLKED
jgi:cell division septum initiation protein DivIVA